MSHTITLTTGQTVETGCYLDGAFGWHNLYRVVEIAREAGMTLSSEETQALTAYAANGETSYDTVAELADKAENYLNKITPEGFYWHFHDGDFFLDVADDDDE